MTSRDFCFWLQGFIELRGTEDMSREQVESVAKHLALVFKHEIDPSMGPAEHQADLDAIHSTIAKAVKKHEAEKPHATLADWHDPNPVMRC